MDVVVRRVDLAVRTPGMVASANTGPGLKPKYPVM